MNLGEFRQRTKNLPDDTDVIVDDDEYLVYCEADIRHVLPPVSEHSYAIIMGPGQEVTLHLDLDARVEAKLK